MTQIKQKCAVCLDDAEDGDDSICNNAEFLLLCGGKGPCQSRRLIPVCYSCKKYITCDEHHNIWKCIGWFDINSFHMNDNPDAPKTMTF